MNFGDPSRSEPSYEVALSSTFHPVQHYRVAPSRRIPDGAISSIHGGRHDRGRRNHDRGRCYNYRSRSYNRSGGDYNRSGSYNVAHDCRRPYCRSRNAPTAMVMMVTGRMVVTRCGMMTGASMESTVSGTGESKPRDRNRCKHYRQFLVHVFLHFLSLLTMC